MRRYFDEKGRQIPEATLLRDLLGRNRERAMQLLGMEHSEARPRSREGFGLRPELVEGEDGAPRLRLVREDAGEG